jgi:hypothetical protein
MNVQRKEYDWIRIAFLIENVGPSSADELSFYFGKVWPDRIRSARSISNTIHSKRRFGFTSKPGRPMIYYFNGQLPKIGRYTYVRWKKKLIPLKGDLADN